MFQGLRWWVVSITILVSTLPLSQSHVKHNRRLVLHKLFIYIRHCHNNNTRIAISYFTNDIEVTIGVKQINKHLTNKIPHEKTSVDK